MLRPDCQQKGHHFPKPPWDRMSQASGGGSRWTADENENHTPNRAQWELECVEQRAASPCEARVGPGHDEATPRMPSTRAPGHRKPSQFGFPATWNYSPAVEAPCCCDSKREERPQREEGRRLSRGKERKWFENQWHGSPSLLHTFWTLNSHPNPVKLSEFSCDRRVNQGLEMSSNATVLTLPWEPFLQDCGMICRTLD